MILFISSKLRYTIMVPFIPLAVSEVMIWGFYREPYIGFPSMVFLGCGLVRVFLNFPLLLLVF